MTATGWLAEWFVRRAPTVKLHPDDNFFQREAIDSFGIIELIEEIERHFGIHLANTDFQDRRFPTIAGLAEIIAERENGAGR
jgi:acyl carrier protein